MPYILKSFREVLDKSLPEPETPGQLNYVITKIVHNYIIQTAPNYTMLNEAIGALECAKLELYRMVIAPYENQKQKENGAISTLDEKEKYGYNSI